MTDGQEAKFDLKNQKSNNHTITLIEVHEEEIKNPDTMKQISELLMKNKFIFVRLASENHEHLPTATQIDFKEHHLHNGNITEVIERYLEKDDTLVYVNSVNNSALDSLTNREREVLKLLEKGFFYKEIADQLEVGLDTVKKHAHNMYHKLGVHNKTEAINKAFRPDL